MKKVLLTLVAVLMAVPAFAIEVYNNGDDTSVEIYGTIRGYLGYGMGMDGDTKLDAGGVSTTIEGSGAEHNFLYGLQGNSRIGTKFKVGGFSGQVELGANEKTLLTQKENTVGLRQAWAAYSFGNAGSLLFGKTDTPTAMSGFISDIYDTDGGLNGFGGSTTGSRRFQIQYSVMGLTLALIEDDVTGAMPTGFTNGGKYTPRGAISYTFKNDSLMAKVALTYTAVNGNYDGLTKKEWDNLHAVGFTFGVRPTFGNSWFSFLFRYGMNEDLYGEAKTVVNNGSFAHTAINPARSFHLKDDGSIDGFNNIHRAAFSLEYGIKLVEQFTFIVGAGYQATIQEQNKTGEFFNTTLTDPSNVIHSYAIFVQGKYDINKYFAFIPQIAWYGTINEVTGKVSGENASYNTNNGGLLIGAQLRASF